jgi:hypothetical protein
MRCVECIVQKKEIQKFHVKNHLEGLGIDERIIYAEFILVILD